LGGEKGEQWDVERESKMGGEKLGERKGTEREAISSTWREERRVKAHGGEASTFCELRYHNLPPIIPFIIYSPYSPLLFKNRFQVKTSTFLPYTD